MSIKQYILTDEPRLRTPYRVVITILLIAGVAIGLNLGIQAFNAETINATVATAGIAGAVPLVLFSAVILFSVRKVDRRTLSEYGIWPSERAWLRECVVGIVASTTLVLAIVGVEVALGAARLADVYVVGTESRFLFGTVSGSPSFATLFASMIAFMSSVAIREELVVRGYLFPNLVDGFSYFSSRIAPVGAIVLTSGLFAAIHIPNPNATVISTAITFIGGVWFGHAYLTTGRLGLPIGLHFGWNVTLGMGVGLPVSGGEMPVRILDFETSGLPMLTGGDYGPEAGVLGLVVILVGIAFNAWYGDGVISQQSFTSSRTQ